MSNLEKYQVLIKQYLEKSHQYEQELSQMEDKLDQIWYTLSPEEIEKVDGKCRYCAKDWLEEI